MRILGLARRTAELVSLVTRRVSLDGGGHPRDRHHGLSNLVEELTGILLLSERLRQQIDNGRDM